MNIVRNLNNKERKILLEYLDIQAFLRNGSVTVWDEHEQDFYKESSVSKTRRVTFSAGVVVGQMAFFENTKHSVEAQADENISTYVLTKSNFNKLLEEHPFVAQDLLLEFCKHLSKRLREVTYEVQILERWH